MDLVHLTHISTIHPMMVNPRMKNQSSTVPDPAPSFQHETEFHDLWDVIQIFGVKKILTAKWVV